MKGKTKNIILLIVGIVFLLVSKSMFKKHNLKKTISACIMAQKQTSKIFDPKKAKEYCEKEIKR
jgi:hypothetical protein|tara:strand:- start:343 stop:534 length:192 start_codon:yes stop_codon:yes gene_type:complete